MQMRRLLVAVHLDRQAWVLASMVAAAIGLETAAAIGLVYIAGFGRMRAVLTGFQPGWLMALTGSLLLSFAGYVYGYRGIFAAEDDSSPADRELRAVVVAGFGGFLAHGTSALEEYALRADGTDGREAKVRVAALGGLEQGVLALASCGAAIGVLAAGIAQPPLSFTVPWAVLPVPGFIVAFWLAERSRGRFAGPSAWRPWPRPAPSRRRAEPSRSHTDAGPKAGWDESPPPPGPPPLPGAGCAEKKGSALSRRADDLPTGARPRDGRPAVVPSGKGILLMSRRTLLAARRPA